MSFQIISPNYVNIVCECTADKTHLESYSLQDLAIKGFVCKQCGSTTFVKAVKILIGQMERDAKIILKGAKELQKRAMDLEAAKKSIGYVKKEGNQT